MSVEFGYCWIVRVILSDFVAVLNQAPDFGGEAGFVVFAEAVGDGFFGDAIDDFLEGFGVLGGVGGLYGLREPLFGFGREGVPVGFSEVYEVFPCPGWRVVVCEGYCDWEVVGVEFGVSCPGVVSC